MKKVDVTPDDFLQQQWTLLIHLPTVGEIHIQAKAIKVSPSKYIAFEPKNINNICQY